MKLEKAGLAALAVAGCIMGSDAVYAQTASQIAPPPDFASPVNRDGDRVAIPESKGPEAPPNADVIFVTLGDVVLAGGGLLPEAEADLHKMLVGKRISVAEIYAAAGVLELKFARSGAPFVRIIVPPQDLVDGGTLTLTLVRGHIERVDTSALPPTVRDRIEGLLAPLVGNEVLSLAEIERQLLLADDTPGVTLRSTLAAGEMPGGIALIIEADYQPVAVSVFADNRLSRSLGGGDFGVQVNLNSLLNQGESIYFLASGWPSLNGDNDYFSSIPRRRALAAGAFIPVGNDGLTVNIEALDARATPTSEPGFPGSTSVFRRASLRVAYPLIRSRRNSVSLRGVLDVQDERVNATLGPDVFPVSLDQLRIVRLGADARLAVGDEGFANITATFSFGLEGLGARSANEVIEVPLSRDGADADIRKFEVNFEVSQPIARHFQVAINGSAQTSFGDAVANSEQFGIAHEKGISPLVDGVLQGDSGYLMRTELRAPFSAKISQFLTPESVVIAPYVFGAVGGLWLERPTNVEQRQTDVAAYGGGLRLVIPRKNGPDFQIGLEYGRAALSEQSNESRFSVNSILAF